MTKKVLSLIIPVLLLSGCSNAKETLGLTKKSPDEFAVVKRAPLSMPKDYALRPPKLGATRPQHQTPSDQAKKAIFSVEQQRIDSGAADGSEGILLKNAKVDETPTNIRTTVEKESASFSLRERPVAEKLLFWQGNEPDAVSINPVEETKRLEEEAARTGQSVKLPTAAIERRDGE